VNDKGANGNVRVDVRQLRDHQRDRPTPPPIGAQQPDGDEDAAELPKLEDPEGNDRGPVQHEIGNCENAEERNERQQCEPHALHEEIASLGGELFTDKLWDLTGHFPYRDLTMGGDAW
jgi:hypothetical protein